MMLNYLDIKNRVKSGETLQSIGEDYGVHKSEISRFCSKYNIETNKGGRRMGISDKDMQKNAGTFLEEFYKIIKKDLR